MKGVRFVVDEKGKRTAVQIDLAEHAELWEDFYYCALARAREREPRETLQAVKARLQRKDRRAAD